MMAWYRSYREYLNSDPFLSIRRHVMRRAGGRCEICRVTIATEVHHLVYPTWGTWDSPTNLKAICHACHCKEHNKAT